jgi:hypothetical protein
MYTLVLLTLHGSDPAVGVPRSAVPATEKDQDDKPATKPPQKKTTKKSPKTKPSSPPLAKPQPAPKTKPVRPKDDRDHDARAHDDDRGDHGAHDDRGSHDEHAGHDADHGSHGDDGHDAHDGGSRPPPAHPPHHSSDHRYARPAVHHLPPNPHAPAPPPAYAPYRGWYTHWWVHPYWRWQHATIVVVTFPFVVDPWVDAWVPPPRNGWTWIPGHFEQGFWVPGHWAPVGPPVVGYVYVPGWWFGDVYVSGYYRVAERHRWRWIDGRYGPDGSYVAGHWEPTSGAPDGYTWEAGFFDGETWVEGYWRPVARTGYRWVPARTTGEGVHDSGYWQPLETRPDSVWIPGWFDGNQWVEGYWVSKSEYDATDPSAWEPDPGWDADDESSDDSAEQGPAVAIPVPDVD